MKVIRDKVEKDVYVEEDLTLHGMIVGDVTVKPGAIFYLHGSLNGKLVIEDDSKVFLHGSVNDDVINEGGHLEVYGVINGRLFRERGTTIIDKDAVVEDK